MKRFTIVLALLLVAALPMMAERVTPETARKVATTFLNNNGAKTNQLTDLSKVAGFQNLYIFTTDNSFVVMSADDCVQPVLGYSLTNTFAVEGMPENISSWLQGYSDEIQWTIEHNTRTIAEVTKQWEDLALGKPNMAKDMVIVNPLVQTNWNQTSPYNNLCPLKNNTRTVTGCVATAMAQIMKFWEHPITGTSSHSYTWNSQTLSANFDTTYYDWANMTNTYSSTSNATQKTAVATLMYHCGVSVEMDYNTSGSGGSSAGTRDVMSALNTYFGYAPCMQYKYKNNYSDEVWITMLKRELNNGRPLQYRGSDAGGNGGHSFVCDGYDSNDKFHFNWGWGSYCDGYYSINNMNPNPDASATGAGNGVYTVGQSAIFCIEPISSLLAPNLSASVSQNVITLTWNNVDDAVSYDVYRDNIKIATSITDNSYVDSNVISGTYYEYYVRAVSGETRSNPSNRVTKMCFYRDYTPSNLTATLASGDATLTWTEPQSNATTLQYATDYSGSRYGMGEGKDTYWREVFAPSRLSNFIGMYIEKVSAYLEISGNYTLFIYQSELNTDDEPTKLYEKTFPVSSSGWNDIELESPILLNCDKELWIMMYYPYTAGSSHTYWYPVTYGAYDEIQYNNTEDEERYNPRLIGELVADSIKWYHVGDNISWLFRTYLTDGTYTYNLYDGDTKLNEEAIGNTTYTHESPETNTIHNYTIKTNYYGGESAASNVAGLTVGTASLEALELGDNDKMTVTQNSTLTVSGTLSNTNPDHLVLEDGAQLFSNNAVQATVKKNIAAWTTETPVGGWYFIASPINNPELAPDSVINMLTDENETTGPRTYDLYRLEGNDWKNYRKNAFDLANGEGYLYANENVQTLSFKGEIKPYNTENNTVTVSAGWNLIGNPYTCDVVPNMAYHTLNNGTSTTSVNANAGLVTPGMGIAVYSENGGTLCFNLPTEGTSTSSNGNLQITLTQQITNRNGVNAVTIDNAIVSFNDGESLPKFTLLEANTKLYIPQGHEEYAIVSSAAQGEMPMNFKASENGTYTLTVKPENVEMSYLYLIDNLTGENINLLANPTYTFDAKTNEYESRFRLLFAAEKEGTETTENESFGFILNGKFQSINGQGLLQVIDLNGRVLHSENDSEGIDLNGLNAGVYVLRLITTNSIKTQKVVVE